MTKEKTSKYLPILIQAVIILLLCGYMVYWGTQKEGYHIDEMYSLMLIRGDGIDRPYNYDVFYNTWYTADDLKGSIGVIPEYAFSGVFESSNPYWHLLHTAYSFTPGEHSIWPSVALNLIFYIGSLTVIYALSLIFIKNSYLAMLPGLLWGLSGAAVNLVVFIRFYMFKTFICLLLVYLVYTLIQKRVTGWRYLLVIPIAILSYLGAFTHQYFLVFALSLSLGAGIYLIMRRRYKVLLIFAGAMSAAILWGYGALPQVSGYIDSVAAGNVGGSSDRGPEAIFNFVSGNSDFIGSLRAFSAILGGALFGNAVFGEVGLFLILALSAIAITLICIKHTGAGLKISDAFRKKETSLWVLTAFICLFYFLMIARIAPDPEYRYISCITPFAAVLFVSLLVKGLEAVGISKAAVVFSLIFASFCVLPAGNIPSFHLRPGNSVGYYEDYDELYAYYHLPVIYVSHQIRDVSACYSQLFNVESEIMFMTTENIDTDFIGNFPYEYGLVLMLQPGGDDEKTDDMAQTILKAAGLREYTYITDFGRHAMYVLT
ncbi:MAG: hypothetical protein FWH17_11595 [Oscillospiraceae bacterium]|nr:hypothetical protein [Oscillospiraceae bacterium]